MVQLATEPIEASGPAQQHLIGFDRGGAITLATRLPVGLAAAGGWRTPPLTHAHIDVLTGCRWSGSSVSCYPLRFARIRLLEDERDQQVDAVGNVLPSSTSTDCSLTQADVTPRSVDWPDRGQPSRRLRNWCRTGADLGDASDGACHDDLLESSWTMITAVPSNSCVIVRGSPGLLLKSGELRSGSEACDDYLMIFVTRPAPTVRPPSRMANFSSSSMAIGWMSCTDMSVLSPGMTMSVPSGRFTTPVTSVVRK